MEKIREWVFPVVLSVAWVFASAYTLSLMIERPQQNVPSASAPKAPVDQPSTPAS